MAVHVAVVAGAIAIFCLDMASTWYLLSKYPKRVKEKGLLGAVLFRMGFKGHLAFASIRVLLLVLVVELTGLAGQLAWSAVTLYAVVNNFIVIRRLKDEIK